MKFEDDNDNQYYGFYRAIVVNNGFEKINNVVPSADKYPFTDKENRGRIQVRINIHTDNKTDIPDENLPWAEQAGSLMFGSFHASKKGISFVPNNGAWVWVFFENGNYMKPVYFASILGSGDIDTIDSTKTLITTKSGHKITIIDDSTKPENDTIDIVHRNGAGISLYVNGSGEPSVAIGTGKKGTIDISSPQINLGGDKYPLLANKPDTSYTIDGMVFKSSKKVLMG